MRMFFCEFTWQRTDLTTDYRHTMAKFFAAQIQIPNWDLDIKAYIGWLMKKLDKELTVPKWVLINQLKSPQMPPIFSAQFVCPSPKVWDFRKKLSLGVRSPWISRSSYKGCAGWYFVGLQPPTHFNSFSKNSIFNFTNTATLLTI